MLTVAGKRILPLDHVTVEPVDPPRAEHDGPVVLARDEHEADVVVRHDPVQQAGVKLFELLARQPLVVLGEVDEPETARRQGDDRRRRVRRVGGARRG